MAQARSGAPSLVDDVNMWIRESWSVIAHDLVALEATQGPSTSPRSILLFGLHYNQNARRSQRVVHIFTGIQLLEAFLLENRGFSRFGTSMRPGVLPFAVFVTGEGVSYVSANYANASDIFVITRTE